MTLPVWADRWPNFRAPRATETLDVDNPADVEQSEGVDITVSGYNSMSFIGRVLVFEWHAKLEEKDVAYAVERARSVRERHARQIGSAASAAALIVYVAARRYIGA